jgi:WD40 repeat protein
MAIRIESEHMAAEVNGVVVATARRGLFGGVQRGRQTLATGGSDGTARLWNGATGQQITPPTDEPVMDGQRIIGRSLQH